MKFVEEDEEMELASDVPRFDLAALKRPPAYARTDSHTACPWAGSYYLCEYGDDTFWNLDRLDNSGQIYSYKAYAYNSSGAGVRAYVVDTGVYGGHTEFDGRVEAGANMMLDPDISDVVGRTDEEAPVAQDGSPANFPCNTWTDDLNIGHGTAVASVLGGRTTGVAKHVTIVPVKIVNCTQNPPARPKLAFARGLDWIQGDMLSRPGVRGVVSLSPYVKLYDGPPGGTLEEDQVCEDASGSSTYTNCVAAIEHEINELIRQNIPVVVSANNQGRGDCRTSPARMGYGNEAGFPSTYRTITVGGTMYTVQDGSYVDQRWECAVAGQCTGVEPGEPTLASNFGPCVSIWAPAWNVRSAHSASATSYRPAGAASSGTSFAAPYVAGIVARILERNPTWTRESMAEGELQARIWQELVNRADWRANMPDFDPSAVVNRRLVYLSPFE